jgi:C4-type Zn-finger protein
VKRALEREAEEHDMRVTQVQNHLSVLNYKITEITQLTMMLKDEKSQYQSAIERMKVQLISYQKTEADLNGEI